MSMDWKRLSVAYCFLLIEQQMFSSVGVSCLHREVLPVYHFIYNYLQQYNTFPTAKHLSMQFGFIPEHCRLEGWVEADLANRLRWEKVRWDTQFFLGGLQKIITNEKETDADRIIELVSKFQEGFYAVTPTETKSIHDAQAIITEYLTAPERAVAHYGFPTLDKWTGGIHEQQFIVLYANTSEGKSTLARSIAGNIKNEGKRVLYFTLEESSKKSVLKTFGTMAHFNPKEITTRTIDPIRLQKLSHYSQQHAEGDIIFVDQMQTKTVGEIARYVHRYKPDVIILDQITLFTNDGDSDWKVVTAVSRQLKGYCQYSKIPMIALTQSTRRSKSAKMDEIGYAYAMAQDADVLLYLWPDEPANGYNRKKVSVLKSRDGERNLHLNMAWELNSGIVQEESEFYGAPTNFETYGAAVSPE